MPEWQGTLSARTGLTLVAMSEKDLQNMAVCQNDSCPPESMLPSDTPAHDRVSTELTPRLGLSSRHLTQCNVCKRPLSEQETVEQRYMQGESVSSLALELSVSRQSLLNHLDALGLRRRKWASIRDQLGSVLDEAMDRKELGRITFRGSDIVQLLKLQAQINKELGDQTVPAALLQYAQMAGQIVNVTDPNQLEALKLEILRRLEGGTEKQGKAGPASGEQKSPRSTLPHPPGEGEGYRPAGHPVPRCSDSRVDAEIEIEILPPEVPDAADVQHELAPERRDAVDSPGPREDSEAGDEPAK